MNWRPCPHPSHDRTVHAEGAGFEVVRYNRAGKWYVEPRGDRKREHVTIEEAARRAEAAVTMGGRVHLRRPGGGAFDRAYARRAEARVSEAVAALRDDTLGLVGYVDVDSAHVRTLLAAWEASTAERDENERMGNEWGEESLANLRRAQAAEAERDRLAGQLTALREALQRAETDVVNVANAGWDSTRLRIATDAMARISEALAGLGEPPEQEARPGVVTDGFVTAANAADVVVPTHVDTAAGTVTEPGDAPVPGAGGEQP